jgi:prolyl-tRNA editing enzyme YbaK/EbsC (Cys-tRNA(Pro) deacylase)
MERCTEYFTARNARFLIDRIQVFAESSATVELAAACLNCRPCEIAKSLSFLQKKAMSKAEAKAHEKALLEQRKHQQQQQGGGGGEPSREGADSVASSPAGSPTHTPQNANVVLIVAAGDAKVSSKKYKEKFLGQPKMLRREEVEALTGFPPGGVCPFGVNDNVKVYLDVSLRRFATVYPAVGTANTGIGLSVEELEEYASNFVEWVDLCEGWQGNPAADNVAAKKAENEAVQAAETSA